MSMVVCLSCKTIVWAYDHIDQDIRGIANMFKLACPQCGEIGNFDGWGVTDWQHMKAIAKKYGYIWNPSSNNQWFTDEVQRRIITFIKR